MSALESPSPRPTWLRLALALIAAPLVLAAFMTLLAYLIAAAGEPTRAGTMARTTGAAWAFFLYLPLFSVTVGLAGALALIRLGLSGPYSWSATGALLGAIASTLLGWVSPAGVVTTHVIVFTVLGLILMSLIRGIAGIKARVTATEEAPPSDDATP